MRARLFPALAGLLLLAAHPGSSHAAANRLPTGLQLHPTPKSLRLRGFEVAVPSRVDVVRDARTDASALRVVLQSLRGAGAGQVRVVRRGAAAGLVVRMD